MILQENGREEVLQKLSPNGHTKEQQNREVTVHKWSRQGSATAAAELNGGYGGDATISNHHPAYYDKEKGQLQRDTGASIMERSSRHHLHQTAGFRTTDSLM